MLLYLNESVSVGLYITNVTHCLDEWILFGLLIHFASEKSIPRHSDSETLSLSFILNLSLERIKYKAAPHGNMQVTFIFENESLVDIMMLHMLNVYWTYMELF